MTTAEKIAMVRAMLHIEDSSEDDTIEVYLTASQKEILSWRYSYSSSAEIPEVVPAEYEMTQVMSVVAGYSQRGAENETWHSENGISRTFKYGDMLSYIRANVIPIAKVIA